MLFSACPKVDGTETLLLPGRPTNLGLGLLTCSECGGGCFNGFSLIYLFYSSFSLSGRRLGRDCNTVS